MILNENAFLFERYKLEKERRGKIGEYTAPFCQHIN